MLGHNDIRTTQIYAEMTDIRISEDTIDLHERIERRNTKNSALLKASGGC